MVHNVCERVPLEDIAVKVLHQSHACQLEPDEYCFEVPMGTTVGELKERLLDAEFRKLGWNADEMVMWERCRPNVILTDNDDFEDGATLILSLLCQWPQSETDDH